MRVRRNAALIGATVFIIVCFSLYLMMEGVKLDESSNALVLEAQLESKIHEMQQDLAANRRTIDKIKQTIKDLAKRSQHVDWSKLLEELEQAADMGGAPEQGNSSYWSGVLSRWPVPVSSLPENMCRFSEELPGKPDIQMLDVFEKLAFDNPDGGAWKQGYPIAYNAEKWKTQKLQVFVIPHSHCDPGWIKTFQQYYDTQTRHILDNALNKLVEYPRMRFIYAEISFFSVWWSELDNSKRETVKKLISENRFELVTGGWVMTDEATAHYFSMLDQLIEGNQWLMNNVGVRPVSGWAIDPFGQSPTMAYILGKSGFDNILLQRVHYSIKKYLSQNKQLEFIWRQNWDRRNVTDVFTHMMPFYSYDVPHTCGPDPKICCQFDFKRLEGGQFHCPWNIQPVPITQENVAARAEMLLDQYRKKSELYKNSVLLVALGDDFRYDKASEWDSQYNNYIKLFDYINSQPDWNAEVRFATLTDYYKALRARAGTTPSPAGTPSGMPLGYPVLSGDFFTYADRDDHYWSGYFTSRPFYKRLSRVLEYHQRSAEIIYSLALLTAQQRHSSMFLTTVASGLMKKVVTSRRHLGLFQHHDAIAGTAKDHVVIDYGQKMVQSLSDMKQVIIESAQYLLSAGNAAQSDKSHLTLDVDETRASHDSLPEKTLIHLTSELKPVVFYNSLAINRTSLVSLIVDNPHVEVRDPYNKITMTQIDPVFIGVAGEISNSIYKVSFLCITPPLGLSMYMIRRTGANENSLNTFSHITLYNHPSAAQSLDTSGLFSIKSEKAQASDSTVSIQNSQLLASFSTQWGILKKVTLKGEDDGGDVLNTEIQWVKYGTVRSKDRSGAYLFLPDGDAEPVVYPADPPIRRVVGRLSSEIHVVTAFCEQISRLINSPGVDGQSLYVYNLVDIRGESNYELSMRLKTDVSSGDQFFSDLNGFQIQRRKHYSKLPLQGNFYPMTSAVYIEDNHYRVTILGAQALGTSSVKSGWLEVIQDRRLDQDDNRGLQQGVRDNKRTPNEFRLLFERRHTEHHKAPPTQPTGYQSLLSIMSSHDLIHPVHVIPAAGQGSVSVMPAAVYEPLQQELPCDLHMLNLRVLQGVSDSADDTSLTAAVSSAHSALLLHRSAIDCSFVMRGATCLTHNKPLTLASMFRGLNVANARSTTLSLVDSGQVDTAAEINVPPMEIKAYVIGSK